MLPRSKRIPGSVLRANRGVPLRRTPFFSLKAWPNGLKGSRFAIVVSTKTAPKAVLRHRIKRRVAVYLRNVDVGERDAVLTVLPPASPLSKTVFEEELSKLFS